MSKFHESMTQWEARSVLYREDKKCKTKEERDALWEEYKPVLRAIYRKEAQWREENPNVMTSF